MFLPFPPIYVGCSEFCPSSIFLPHMERTPAEDEGSRLNQYLDRPPCFPPVRPFSSADPVIPTFRLSPHTCRGSPRAAAESDGSDIYPAPPSFLPCRPFSHFRHRKSSAFHLPPSCHTRRGRPKNLATAKKKGCNTYPDPTMYLPFRPFLLISSLLPMFLLPSPAHTWGGCPRKLADVGGRNT